MAQSTEKVTLSNMFRFVFGQVLNRKWLLILNIVALTVISLLEFVIPQYTQYIIDHVIPKHDIGLLTEVVLGLLATAIVLGVLSYVSTYYMGVMSQGAITNLRTELYQSTLQLDTQFFESSKTGDLMVRLTSDINNLQSLISANMLSMIGSIITFIFVWIYIFILNWQMAIAITITFPFMFLIYRIFRNRIHNAFRAARASQAQMSNQMQNTLTQIDLIKSYTNEEFEEQRFGTFANKNKQDMIRATQNQALFSPLIDFVNYLGTAIILAFGAYFVIHHQLTVGQLVAYLAYIGMLQGPIRAFTQILNQLQQSLVSYGRVMDIMALRPIIVDQPNAVPFPTMTTGVQLKDVSFTYPESDQPSTGEIPAAVSHVSFNILFGKTTALVGHSGSGKTTLTKLIDHLYNLDAGDILFDGRPISQIQLQSLRENIAIVSQDIYMLDGSIRDNVRYGRSNATDDEIWQVIEMADIADFVHGLPQGLDTQIGERGVKLSGGQKQRLSIARALLKNAQLVILDEATASLDNESEKTIQHALENLMQSRTSLVIAHRLSTIHNADQIIVMDHGQVVERGTHTELLAANGPYAKLYNAQFN
ncbi:ABC transporter ATP-binding protein [Furfurilactobacillus milii]|uniref:ATP-binding cassette domain-containing protein n=1 Tax=Furfurilactobacillus milii TaxID=2888272 RepID=A0A6N9I3E3_9LACO|nr:ABC transporter ATP-binding protein [Furfurilactobacillus milii]MYV17359.1 ATP-binding cassette domain-containing protein [Furfurilactobacillus milii]